MAITEPKRLGIIGGLGALAGADILFKIVKASTLKGTNRQFDILFEQEPFDDLTSNSTGDDKLTERKLYVYKVVKELEARSVDTVVLPCFISHTFLREIVPEISARVVDIMEALKEYLVANYPTARKLGVVTSAYVQASGMFEASFAESGCEILYPDNKIQEPGLHDAVYGSKGIKAGCLTGMPLENFQRACDDLIGRGAEIIVPGLTEFPLIQHSIAVPDGIELVDCNQVYADFALQQNTCGRVPEYKIGIIGGVGPMATVDFMEKVIRQTEATKDQDHVKMVVEHNPQIPDRTDNLLGDGLDPTIPLLAAAKRLEADNADMIAIPCNTAHAFVERIQRHISIPVVHMIYETACAIRDDYPLCRRIGLLATSGTVESRVYHQELEAKDLQVIVPDGDHQEKVMAAIYGKAGVKAGNTTGLCVEHIVSAMHHLADRGAQAMILGCTELPLLVEATDSFPIGDQSVVVLDPTEIMARNCVAMAQHPANHHVP
jgi:aspartate racemase